ncbi:MAG: hypothetical protein E7461_04345 [Ruminococcaceae bacterium]|nr:hypothetical protein [Oscillospiraceae bacterium]
MLSSWYLPQSAKIGGREYKLRCDFRDVLRIFSYFNDPDLADVLKWQIALSLFYEGEIPQQNRWEAMAYLADFITCGKKETGGSRRLLDWEQDGNLIIGEVNRVAGYEIRQKEFIHWWTFLSYFHAIGEGQLSFLLTIRQKRLRGEKLTDWEERYFRENRETVELKTRYSKAEMADREKLLQMLADG